MTYVQKIQCDKCQKIVIDENYLVVDVVVETQDRVIAEQTYKDCEIRKLAHICSDCCITLLEALLDEEENPSETLKGLGVKIK